MEKKVTEVVAALIWEGDRFLICQRPAHKARGLLWEFVGGKVERPQPTVNTPHSRKRHFQSVLLSRPEEYHQW